MLFHIIWHPKGVVPGLCLSGSARSQEKCQQRALGTRRSTPSVQFQSDADFDETLARLTTSFVNRQIITVR